MYQKLGLALALLIALISVVHGSPWPGYACWDKSDGTMMQYDSDNCALFIYCWKGEEIIRECPEPLVFHDLWSGFCDKREYVKDCGGRYINCAYFGDGTYADREVSNQYYTCKGGKKTLHTCPPTLQYCNYTKRCELFRDCPIEN